ncbi:hypothetical protein COXBURSA331_A1491 [Coxiella burnetii RSA 331]|nr:hypothetical protein COXBURSA331_A1491 [Coxiella burnetii RSA 331]AIT63459.1 hypothetical protein CBNA_1199 [Coxiella burnetii str. Namibia]MDE3399625.1 hypothetical protein [Coxiella burnetii]
MKIDDNRKSAAILILLSKVARVERSETRESYHYYVFHFVP